MRIRTFCKYVEQQLEPLVLRDTPVVVDGSVFFSNSYQGSGLTHAFGCECDRYAVYLRERLAMFKRANVTCYFLFHGGHEHSNTLDKIMSMHDNDIVVPIFMHSIVREVLKEMEFEYVVCQYESKRDIIALAQKLKCPVISNDVEMGFSGLQYIPMDNLQLNDSNDAINCSYFLLKHFLQRNNLTSEKIALFIVLTDEVIFPQHHFLSLFKHIKAGIFNSTIEPQKSGYFLWRNSGLLKWLSENHRESVLRTINNFVLFEDRERFLEVKKKAMQLVNRRERGGLGAATLLDRGAARVARADPDWFAKGVAGEHIAKRYVNLYRSQHYYGEGLKVQNEKDDSKLLTLEIVKYAYDLLTDFDNDGFHFVPGRQRKEYIKVGEGYSIRKPEYSAKICVFENGWDSVGALGLLEHFLRESLGVEPRALQRLPARARLLVVALLYFARKKPADASAAARCVLLAYVTLSLVFPKAARLPILESTTDEDSVTVDDCSIAAAIMENYHAKAKSKVDGTVDRGLLHPLVEFQHCLMALVDLNALCGAPLPPPALRRSFNGSLVYRLRRAMRDAGDATTFLDQLLSPAPTVYAFLNGLIEAYEEMANSF